MFTGIVQVRVVVAAVEKAPGLMTLTLVLPEHCRDDVTIGASIAIDGVCLTVTSYDPVTASVQFDIMQQTLELTALSRLVAGDIVNLERSAKMGDEIGGHQVSGHIDATAEVIAIELTENNCRISFSFPSRLTNYLFLKGFVALNGCSLTIADFDANQAILTIAFIPETLRATNHGLLAAGDRVNLEIDRQTQVIVDSVERILNEKNLAS